MTSLASHRQIIKNILIIFERVQNLLQLVSILNFVQKLRWKIYADEKLTTKVA